MTAKKSMKKPKVGDKVRIHGAAPGTCWEFGIVAEVSSAGILINYGSIDLPIYGMGIRKEPYQLEVLK